LLESLGAPGGEALEQRPDQGPQASGYTHYSIGSRCQLVTPTPLTSPVNRTGRTAGPPIPRPSKAVGNTFRPMLQGL
jgi:hypothetical protein